MYNILICDDEKDIVSALHIYLNNENYNIIETYDGAEALKALSENDIHLILMDIMMPKLDGISALKKLRERNNTPVILLTAKGEDTDKILGLDVGADDYITKPFNPMEVVARVRAQLRRYTSLGGAATKNDMLRIGEIELDDKTKTVKAYDKEVSLTPTEYEILKLLMQNPNKVFSSKEIYESVWNDLAYGAEGTVAVHIRNMREKLEINPSEPRYLKVVWGQGYKMEEKA